MNYKILWVEDDSYKIGDLVLPLKKDGCHISVYETMNSVMSIIDKLDDYDIILLDVLIPEGVDRGFDKVKEYVGVDLLYKIKRSYPDIPILVLSVVSDDEVLNKIKRAKVNKIITKGSCLPSQLKKEVYEQLEMK